MKSRPRTFLLDENMPRKVLTSLRREGFNTTRVYDAGLRSQPDVAIFAHACAHQMTIITFDTDYLNQTAFPPPHAGNPRPTLLFKGYLCDRACLCHAESSGTTRSP